ncbi:ATP-binding cassette domain-containing protein [Gordonibacter massiliensis (ex Traore et al. 2017)]|uniref:ATP-binding cassette domain-containing protein n=1 Tax=Gordonibacter massiliensis (ex Traore et al. 2017) TaxID=1841863 RepID=UPI001C8CC01B|nr:ABC transporter ATP-binding protein [Gordonibacter massiliensis (ex Traore et al. 2017)]MBX9033266.1 ABC transporter ATP-binding protein [Gordonibacter massiliensis (ex Traore et al. 2017)]
MCELRAEHLTKRFGKTTALDDVTLSFEYGKIHALLGRNGAGKTTLLGVASNRLIPTSGQALVDGEPVTDNPRALAKVFCTGDVRMIPPSMCVDDLVGHMGRFHEGFDAKRALRLAKMFELDVKAKTGALSTGYRSICQLVMALSLDVDYLLLDEPVLGLDAAHRDLFYRLLMEDYLERGRAVVVATHLIEEVATLVERVAIIDEGRLLMEASADELRTSGYSVSGRAEDVRAYCEGLEVLGIDELGSLAMAYVQGEPVRERLTDRLDVAPMSLQKLFVELTGKGE